MPVLRLFLSKKLILCFIGYMQYAQKIAASVNNESAAFTHRGGKVSRGLIWIYIWLYVNLTE